MSGQTNQEQHPDLLPESTLPEGRAAHAAGLGYADNPYEQWGEAKWGWAMGWIDAENAMWKRRGELAAAVVIVIV
jgi:hypothetical protein